MRRAPSGWIRFARRVVASTTVILGGVTAFAPPSDAAAVRVAVVRVDQVGYDIGSPDRTAFVLARHDERGTAFDVLDDMGASVSSGSLGATLGGWNTRFPFVHAIDLASVALPGTYTIRVDTSPVATSVPFQIDDPATVFEPLLSNALAFFEAQRDGPHVIGSVLDRMPAHLHDRHARVFRRARYTRDDVLVGPRPVPDAGRVDVSGGWFDAGDYIKGVMTESYAATMLLLARRDFPALLGPGSEADLTPELRFELRWLLRMWDDDTRTLYYQVGFGDGNDRVAGDHDIWRLPQVDDTYGGDDPRFRFIRNRPVFRAAPPGSPVSPNLAGRLAAAFGLCSHVFRSSDVAFADRCLLAGQHVFDLADRSPGRLLTFSPFDYYPETEWHSDLELAAAELYLATSDPGVPTSLPHPRPRRYLVASSRWADAYLHHDGGDTLNLYDVGAVAHAELARDMDLAGSSAGLRVERDDLVRGLRRQLASAAAVARSDPFGYGFRYDEYDGTSHAQGLAITASLYAELSGDHRYDAFGRRQLDVVLGANAWGTSFIVGAGEIFPRCVHHQVANIVGALDGSSPLLLGAAVNGPNGADQFSYLGLPDGARRCPTDGGNRFSRFDTRRARWWDNARSWPTAEPAIDFASTTPLAFALAISG